MGLAGLNLRIVEPNVSADHEFLAAKDQLESAREAYDFVKLEETTLK